MRAVYVVVCAVLVVVCASVTVAQSNQCLLWSGRDSSTYTDPGSACASYSQTYNTNSDGSGDTITNTVTLGDKLSDTSYKCQGTSTTTCNAYHAQSGAPYCGQSSPINGLATTATTGPCPVTPCTAKAGTSVDTVVESGPQAAGGMVYDAQGCQMQIKSAPVNIVGCHGGCSVQSATYTGQQQQSGTPTSQAGSNCVSSSGGTMCSEDQNGKNCGTFNGDEVCPQSLPPGTCQSYASGGVACTMAPGASAMTTPPGPDNGTPGQPATPTAQVQAPVTANGQTTQVTINYYSSTTVQASAAGVPSSSGGLNVGNSGSSGSSGNGGGGGGPSAANGDCGASGVNCASDGTVPTLPTEPTIGQSTQTYTSALGQVPIVAAVSGLAASVPSGQCPTASLSVFGHEFVMDAQCTLWADLTPLLSACFLAMWTILGVRIVMSA